MSDTNCPHCKETHNVWESCKTELCREREAHNQTKRERDEAREKAAQWERIALHADTERDELREKLEDWENCAKHVRSEWPDEQHCSCVPILRKLLKDAERERDEAREQNAKLRDIAERAIVPLECDGVPYGAKLRAKLDQLKENKQ